MTTQPTDPRASLLRAAENSIAGHAVCHAGETRELRLAHGVVSILAALTAAEGRIEAMETAIDLAQAELVVEAEELGDYGPAMLAATLRALAARLRAAGGGRPA